MYLSRENKKASSPSNSEWTSLFRASPLAYLVGLYLICFYLELHLRKPFLAEIRFQFLFGALIGTVCLVKYVRQTISYPTTGLTKSALALIGIMGIYTLYTFDPETSSRVYSDRVIKFSIVAFFIYCAVDKIEDLRVIIFSLFLVWLKLGQEGFYGWASGNLMWENQGIMRLHGSTTMFRHPNSLSGFAVGCLPFCFFFYFAIKNSIFKWAILALVAACLLIILTTGSRTGYVALLLSFIAFIMTFKKYRGILFGMGAILGLLAYLAAPVQYKERFHSIFTGEEREGRSSEKRLQILQDAAEVFIEYPMGVGVGAFPSVRWEMFGRSQDTHNLYMEVLTNIGWIGFIIFSWFIYQLIKTAKTTHQKIGLSSLEEDSRTFIQATLYACIGFIFARLFLGLFGMDMYEIYWWLAMGLILACLKLLYLKEGAPSRFRSRAIKSR